jgi:hypothetical protein
LKIFIPEDEAEKERHRQYRIQKGREYHLKKTYGINLEQYDLLLKKQDNKCAICKRHSSEFPKRLSVDHDHKTGEIRGLLCTHCNRYVVGRNTDGDILRRVAEYIEQGTGWFVPNKTKKRKKWK